MIHSLSGGVIKTAEKYTFVKVLFDGEEKPTWLICDDPTVEVGDVAAADGKTGIIKGKVIRADKGVSGDCAPVPVKRMRKTIAIIKEK
ncbi:MAG TPA: hypothetical protein DDW54_01410 [Clostridiales bacterium]|nr:hypothetical protein [Clostridiales bacterium]